MGKLFGRPPSYYFDLDDPYTDLAIDYACAGAHWADENEKYRDSKELAQNEAGAIGQVLERMKEEAEGRG